MARQKLDEINKKIIEILRRNSRISIREIAEKVNAPESTVSYRIKRLVESGIIRAFTIELDPRALGKEMEVILLMKLRNIKKKDQIIEKLSERELVYKHYLTSGKYNLVCIVYSSGIESLEETINNLGETGEIEVLDVLLTVRD